MNTQPNNLRTGISDLANNLNKIRNNTGNAADQEQLEKILRVLFMFWEDIIRKTLNNNDPAYKEALQSLHEATEVSDRAIKKVGKVADAIGTAVKAAKAVDVVLGGAIKLFL